MTHSMIPAGWELHPQQAQAATLSPESGDYLDYGGADFSSVEDANGHLFFAAFAKPPNGSYAFYIFRDAMPLPISPRPIGRGQIQPQFRIGSGALTIFYTYVAGTNSVPMRGVVPQFAPFVVPLGTGSARPPVLIPSASPIWAIYRGEYLSDAEVASGPAFLFGRLNKMKGAIVALIDALEASGAIVKAP